MKPNKFYETPSTCSQEIFKENHKEKTQCLNIP